MTVFEPHNNVARYDAVLIGAGIMSATLAALLNELDSNLRLLLIERLDEPGLESSAALNNAGTGHAANCELNYTPIESNGEISLSKALAINVAFERSLEFWASLAEKNKLSPNKFLHLVPHLSLVWGEKDVAFLKKRYEKLIKFEGFSKMQMSINQDEISEWIPLVMEGRQPNKLCACTKIDRGTDVNFGLLSKLYLEPLINSKSLDLKLSSEVLDINRDDSSGWRLSIKNQEHYSEISTKFVFIGAGGWALPLLQKSGIPEASEYGGFPVSGQWLVCSDSSLCSSHNAKVYGKAKSGSPPMSMPHLDSRWIDGNRSLLFGPFAGFSTKFLKKGSRWDLLNSVNRSNIRSMFQVGLRNFELVNYLIDQALQSQVERFNALKEFLPMANKKDWNLSIAGQRVQIIKRTSKGGKLQMGTEVVTSKDGSLAALLGASPGASTAVQIMLEVLQRCWPDQLATESWQKKLKELLPSYGNDLQFDGELLKTVRDRNNSILRLS